MPRHRIPSGPRVFIDDHCLGAENQAHRRGHVFTITGGAVVHQCAPQVIQNVVRVCSAAVKPLIHDRSLLAGLRKEIAVKERVSPGCRVGKIDVRQLSMTQLVDFSAVAFHPRQFSKTGLALNRDNGHVARARAVRIRPHAEQHRFSGGLFKKAIDVVAAAHFALIDSQ